ncbi:hypothetical protein OKW21_004636 [Catalinimonas alkaloidigena]|uniref:pinensin family lanthipeptide n=1 Tax=Catalinimonas alkaloidigena TaxID=1075417 RepID=UPI00240699F6|nr:pinensin family lanthipeptide [Catalinimonas alkaloidigena]MDF9799373.1 hypothetical protein [Catalinimonas alkaloidigena]
MTNEKINLEELQVESFVTSLSPEEQAAQKGGTSVPCVSAVSATVASATAVSALSYDITKDSSWWNCKEDDQYAGG